MLSDQARAAALLFGAQYWRQIKRWIGTQRGTSRRPGMNGTRARAAVSTVIRITIPRSALCALKPRNPVSLVKGGTWYHMVYSHSHVWPGYCPVSFIIPHWLPVRLAAVARPERYPPSPMKSRLWV